MRDVMKFLVAVLVSGFLIVGTASAAQCFTEEKAAKLIAEAGGSVAYETDSPVAVALALEVTDGPKKADKVRVYTAPNSKQALFIFYIGGCVAAQNGTPAYKDEQAMMYILPIEVAQQIVDLMLQAKHRSSI